jgi:CubicO group peptidase (beta-lactamase class C family)
MSGQEEAARQALAEVLREGVHEGVFPGAVAAVGQLNAGRATSVFAAEGLLAPGEGQVELDTFYDLASLTKPVVASTVLRLCQRGVLDLEQPVSRWLPELAGTPGGTAPLALLLSHRAGLSPWGGLFRDIPGPPGSSAARAYLLQEAATRTLLEPRSPGSVYSDLGYMIVGEALARAAGAPLELLIEREVATPLGHAAQLFYAAALPSAARPAFVRNVAPTEFCSWRGRLVRAEVHDENCAAHGGICGHAGLFGRVQAVLAFGLEWLRAWEGRSTWLDRALVHFALRPRPFGGHVIGWDTKSAEGSSAGAVLSARAFGHLGFTGTSVWCDPVRQRCIVLLSNRVHPTRENIAIRTFRPRFHDLAAALELT